MSSTHPKETSTMMSQADQNQLERHLKGVSKKSLDTLTKGLLLAESLPAPAKARKAKKPVKKTGAKKKGKK
jgi:hypothetical protein